MKHIKIYENNNNDFIDFVKLQNKIFKNIKDYLINYEKDITPLKIIKIIRIQYNEFDKTIKIWFQDHRTQFDFDLTLNKTQTKRLIEYINDPELFINANKYNI